MRRPLTPPGYTHLTLGLVIDRIEPQRLISFRWRPYLVDPERCRSTDPTTLVALELYDDREGTRLTVTESGFGRIPIVRRAEAVRKNSARRAGQRRGSRRMSAARSEAAGPLGTGAPPRVFTAPGAPTRRAVAARVRRDGPTSMVRLTEGSALNRQASAKPLRMRAGAGRVGGVDPDERAGGSSIRCG